MIRIFRRAASTRSKKIPVQLLKNFEGLGERGEVLYVSEGMMRNKLHHGNGAKYVLTGEPLSIPVKIRQEPLPKLVKEEAALEDAVVEPKNEEFVLDFLDFPGENPSQSAKQSARQSASQSTDTAESQAESQAKDKTDTRDFEWQSDIVANITKNRR